MKHERRRANNVIDCRHWFAFAMERDRRSGHCCDRAVESVATQSLECLVRGGVKVPE
jgi:hypothetical protein